MPYRMTVSSLIQAEQHEMIDGSIRKEIKLINDGFFCSEDTGFWRMPEDASK